VDIPLLLQQLGPGQLWRFLPIGYLVTIAIETPILFFGLSARHSRRRRLLAGVWLTACTYPVVTLVLPLIMANYSRAAYLLVAEVFAPIAECVLFWLAFGSGDDAGRRTIWRDFAVIVVANLASFMVGEILNVWDWFGLY
jgi:hypothetical protein